MRLRILYGFLIACRYECRWAYPATVDQVRRPDHMGRPADDRNRRMTPPTRARRRAVRAVLGALAGGGLTAAGLGGPLAASTFADHLAEVTAASEVTAGGEPPAETTATAAPAPTPPPATTTTTTPPSTTTTPQPAAPSVEQPAVVLQRRQKTTERHRSRSPNASATTKANGNNNVEGSPQSVAKAGALAAVLASSQASVQALAFYRVPLFLLADLQGRRRPVRRAVADPRGDQRNRDGLRRRPVGLQRRRRGLDAVHARNLDCSTGWTRSTPATPTPTTRSTPCSPPRATCAPPVPPRTSAGRSSPTTTPKNTSTR